MKINETTATIPRKTLPISEKTEQFEVSRHGRPCKFGEQMAWLDFDGVVETRAAGFALAERIDSLQKTSFVRVHFTSSPLIRCIESKDNKRLVLQREFIEKEWTNVEVFDWGQDNFLNTTDTLTQIGNVDTPKEQRFDLWKTMSQNERDLHFQSEGRAPGGRAVDTLRRNLLQKMLEYPAEIEGRIKEAEELRGYPISEPDPNLPLIDIYVWETHETAVYSLKHTDFSKPGKEPILPGETHIVLSRGKKIFNDRSITTEPARP